MGKGQHCMRNRVSDRPLQPIRLGFTGGYTGIGLLWRAAAGRLRRWKRAITICNHTRWHPFSVDQQAISRYRGAGVLRWRTGESGGFRSRGKGRTGP